jgi:hypothetical protein
MDIGAQLANLRESEGPDTPDEFLFAGIAIGDHVAQGGQTMRSSDTVQLFQRAINPGSLWGAGLARWGCLLHAAEVSAVTRAIEPSPVELSTPCSVRRWLPFQK